MNREKEVKAYLEGKLSQAEKLKYEIADEMFLKILPDASAPLLQNCLSLQFEVFRLPVLPFFQFPG